MMSMQRSRLFPPPGLALVLLAGLGVLGSAALSPPALAAHQGASPPAGDELAALEQQLADVRAVSRAFNLVSKVARPGVVHLRVTGGEVATDTSDEDDLEMEQLRRFLRRMPPAAGSGIIFDREGYILTNNHVVENRSRITVVLHDQREFPATIVGTDPKTDLAVIKIDAPDLQPLKFGDSDQLEVGDWVIAVGSPFGLQQTVTHGIVSAKGRSRIPGVDIDYQDFIQTDASINPGNSGGPLLNLRGEVVGVNTAIATRGDGFNAGVAFTIPSRMAMRIANELKTSGVVQRGWIGISYVPVDAGFAELLDLGPQKGVVVMAVQRRSPADRAGLQVDDVVVAINGKPIDGTEQFRSMVADMRPDERVKLRVLRDGQARNIDLRLGVQAEVVETPTSATWIMGRTIARLGIEGRTEPAPLEARGADGLIGGVRITRIEDARSRAGDLRPNEFILSCNGTPVRGVRQFNELLQETRRTDRLVLEVIGGGGARRTVTIPPEGEK